MLEGQNHTFQQLYREDAQENSLNQIVGNAVQMEILEKKSTYRWKRYLLFILAAFALLILIAEDNSTHIEAPIIQHAQFDFLIFCPQSFSKRVSIKQKLLSKSQNGTQFLTKILTYTVELANTPNDSHYDFNNTYLVEVQSRNHNGKVILAYCGLVTRYGSSCESEVFPACSTPGPIFDLNVDQLTDIIWINKLNPDVHPVDDKECLTGLSRFDCNLLIKVHSAQTSTDLTSQQYQNYKISPHHWPVSTHVHGSQVRPSFNGHPLSWIDNTEERGMAAFTLSDTFYSNTFDRDGLNNSLPPSVIVKRTDNGRILSSRQVKINRYPNKQNPGNLFYHDHAAKLTHHNVKYGLIGLYLLRKPLVEEQIGVHKDNEKLVVMTVNGWRTSRNLQSPVNVVNRFRFINSNFGPQNVYRIFFVYGTQCEATAIPISFTIIGADSSLFHKGIYNQTDFVIAQGERVELLIIFNSTQTSYSICSQSQNERSSFRFRQPSTSNIENIRLTKQIDDINTRKEISEVILSVPQANLNLPKFTIAVKRMRPLMLAGEILSINGRTSFHAGRSENPTIGTYEDWYLINTLPKSYPISMHFTNFQIVKVLNLRKVRTCVLYELDFIIAAILTGSEHINDTSIFFNPKNTEDINYNVLCEKRRSIISSLGFSKRLEQVNVEDVVDQNRVSGIDVTKKISEHDRKLFSKLRIPFGADQTSKYVLNGQSLIRQYHRRWKDTALIEAGKVFVLRIRWTKPDYDENKENDPYFNMPHDQLVEYPGFVYHSHLFGQEYSQMIRPIMLQLPSNILPKQTTPSNEGPDLA